MPTRTLLTPGRPAFRVLLHVRLRTGPLTSERLTSWRPISGLPMSDRLTPIGPTSPGESGGPSADRIRPRWRRRWLEMSAEPDRGSIIPLILGFCLLALVFISGAVALSDVFTQQRSLQSVCDGAAIYAANNVDPGALHGNGATTAALPLADASKQVSVYLHRDAQRSRVDTAVQIAADGVTVQVTCREHNDVAFGFVILRADGVDQTAHSAARSRVVR